MANNKLIIITNDGLIDIYVSTVSDYKNLKGHNRLYINNGNLTFTEKSKDVGLDFKGFGTHASFFDYDNDGDLDVGGKVFTEEVYASNQSDARETATARNPRAKVIGINPIVGS